MSISESEIRIAALEILAESPNGFMATADLIPALEEYFEPDGRDTEIIEGRADTYFSQKVRNLISHRESASGLTSTGYAIYDSRRRGLSITDAGRTFLRFGGD